MTDEGVEGIKGWLLVYVIASIPVLLFYSAGLSGWVLDYPLWLFIPIFVLLAVPLLLILLKSPRAPRWNIAMLWIATALMILRILFGVLFQARLEGRTPPSSEELLAAAPILLGVVIFSLVWATVWSRYFQRSARVRNTFAAGH